MVRAWTRSIVFGSVIAVVLIASPLLAHADLSDEESDGNGNNYEQKVMELRRWREYSNQQKQSHQRRAEGAYRDCMEEARTRAERRACGTIDTIAQCSEDGCVVVDPEEIAREVIARLSFPDATPVFGPDPSVNQIAPGKLVVGFPYWMSVAGETTRSVSETAQGLTLRMDARRAKVVYSMGDGTSLTCTRTLAWPGEAGGHDGRGIPLPSPVCGHAYATTGSVRVTATVHWEVTWHGGGQSGVVPLSFTDSLDLEVVEVHTVVR